MERVRWKAAIIWPYCLWLQLFDLIVHLLPLNGLIHSSDGVGCCQAAFFSPYLAFIVRVEKPRHVRTVRLKTMADKFSSLLPIDAAYSYQISDCK